MDSNLGSDYSVSGSTLGSEDGSQSLQPDPNTCQPNPREPTPAPKLPQKLSDDEIQQIARTLEDDGSSWAANPRLYAVLRLIDKLDASETFAASGITDLWLPMTRKTFPKGLDADTRSSFLVAQSAVLSDSLDLEKGERGLHRHYAVDEDIPFRSKGFLGKGSYGEVDHVKSTLTGIEYARKKMPRKLPSHHGEQKSRQVMDDFEKEIRNIKHLSHRHIVKLVGSYTDPDSVALIMSPVAQLDLRVFLESFTPTHASKELLSGFFGCLVIGLAYMHRQSVRHKDIKPANILIKGDSVLYTDLGLAFYWDNLGHSTTEQSFPTATRKYSPPEVFLGEKRNTSADIWALGCVFLEMMSVLYGSDLNKLREHLEMYGTQSTIYGMNHDGAVMWIDQLKSSSTTERGRIMLELAKSMLNKTPWKRPGAQVAFDRISFIDAMADGVSFIGDCCKPNTPPMTDESTLKAASIPTIQVSRQTTSDSLDNYQEASHHKSTPSPTRSEQESVIVNTPPSSPLLSHRSTDGLQAEPSATPKPKKRNRPDRKTLVLNASLSTAIAQKDVEKARSLLEQGANVNYQDYEGMTFLTKAVRASHTELVSLFLEMGADIHLQDREGETCFHYAADTANMQIISILLDEGANPDLAAKDGRTPIYYSVLNKHCNRRELIKLLVSRGANPKANSKSGGALHKAAANGSSDVIEDLVALGVNINSVSSGGSTPLYLSASNGHPECLEKLLSLGASMEIPRSTGATPLVAASRYGKEDVVKKLLEHGANINAKDDSGCTSLFWASQNGHVRVAEALLSSGRMDMNQQLDKHRCTPLHGAALNKKDEAIKLLIEHGASIDARNTSGLTPLHQAVYSKSPPTVKIMLEYGADPLAVTKRGASAVDIAVKEGLIEILHLLEDALDEEEQG